MPIALYLNGTDDHTDGTLATPGNGITLGAVESIVTVHLRSPAGYANAEAVTVPAPVDCHVSADGVTYGETATYAIGAIPDTNTPCHVKRVVNTVTPPGSDPYRADIALTPRAALVAVEDVTAPVIAGTLTAVAGVGQVTLSGPTATDNAGIAKWQYRVDGGAWVDIASTSETMPSTVVSGLSAGATYAFEVRALDAAGNASAVRSASAVPAPLFSDDFSGTGALSTTNWSTSTAGSGTASRNGSGKLVINSVGAVANAALVAYKPALTLTAVRTYRTKARVIDNSLTQADILSISQKETGYPAVAPSTVPDWHNSQYSMGPYLRFEVRAVSGVPYVVTFALAAPYSGANRWNVAASQWSTTALTTDGYALTLGVDYIFEIDTNAEGVRWTLRADTEAVIFQTTRLPWASIAAYDYPAYLVMGEVYTSHHTAEVHHDYFSVV